MEQIRIIKEMREHDRRTNSRANEHIRPRYMVWENVPGAFSSNKGEDFRAVLEETAKIADETAVIPGFEGGRWTPSGCILGNGWSIAWRVHDAQFWGVPQRRKRIALVADFGGYTAPEILFEREGVSRDIEQGCTAEQNAAAIIGADLEETSGAISFQERGGKPGGEKVSSYRTNGQEPCQRSIISQLSGIDGDVAETLDAHYYKGCGEREGKERTVVYGIGSYDSNAMKSSNPHSGIYESETTRTLDNNGGNPACNQGGMIVLEGNGTRESHKGDGYRESETMYTLNTVEQHAVCVGNGQTNLSFSDKAGALNCMHDQQAVLTYGLDRASFNQGQNAQYDFSVEENLAQTIVARGPGGTNSQTVGALCARDYKGVGNQYVNEGKCIIQAIKEGDK